MLAATLSNVDKLNMMEEGGYQAARAVSHERLAVIVVIVATSLSQSDADVVRRKPLLRILDQLNDDQLILLNAYGQSYGGSFVLSSSLLRLHQLLRVIFNHQESDMFTC